VLRGKDDAFLSLLEDHKGILVKIAGAYCANPADRPDLVQEMVVQLWRSFGRYDERHRFSTWMYRVALNVAISFYRSQSRSARHATAAGDAALEAIAAPPEESDEDVRTLLRVIEGLGEMERALVVLYLDGNSYATIAEVLGISETNVGTKLSRIKERIRRNWPLSA
jgi:RNA polymerase sigma-70 factor (ECF subfamily)